MKNLWLIHGNYFPVVSGSSTNLVCPTQWILQIAAKSIFVELTLVYCVFYHKYDDAADDGYGEESETEPCGDDAKGKGDGSCKG